MGDKLVNVKASTAQDFIDNSHKAMRDPKKLGETTYDLQVKFKTDSKTKTIAKAKMTLTTETTRVHWAGPGNAKPDKANADAIKDIEDRNEAHERAHRDSYKKAFDKLQDDLEEEMVGKTPKDAQAILDKMKAALREACEKLHKSEGMIDVNDDGKGNITIKESAEGPGGCQ
jgi:uncharacterized protein YlxW (UPF0749 family)